MTPNDARRSQWLADLAKVPTGATWPRLMTGPHPAAVGSYGKPFTLWVAEHGRWPLWWWQQLAATRLLEHDADGRLVWRTATLSTSRQCGKSYLLGMLAMWRITQGPEIFGEPQNTLHIASNLNVARTVQQPMRAFGRQRPDEYKVLESGARIEIEHVSGSTWMLRSSAGGYGHSASFCIVDESWAVAADVVDDAIVPTQAQRLSPQLLLVSTANAKATSLMVGRRAGALADLEEPDGTLWIEWSAHPDDEIDDMEAWRAASPQWDENRQREISNAYASALRTRPTDPTEPDPLTSFETQWLNRWRSEVEPRRPRGEPLVDLEVWQALEHDEEQLPGPVVVAIEDHFGHAACLAVGCLLGDGRIYLETETFENPEARGKAFARAGQLLEHYTCSRLLVGASIVHDQRAVDLYAEPVGTRETAVGLPLLRSLLADGRIVHFNSGALSDQLAECRVTRTAGGQLSLVPGPRSDALRAAVWVAHSIEQDPPTQPAIW